jgi:Flp pilus assembly protein CpaB
MTYRLRNITIAIALALVAALLTGFYVKNYQRDVRKDETNVPVYVAKVDIPAGTSGAQVARSGMMTKTEIVRRGVVPGAISNPAQLATQVATEPIYAGEQVSTRRFASPSESGVRAQLTGVQRAISIPGDQHQLMAGTLKAGDKIDLVATFGVKLLGSGEELKFTRIVLRDVEVLRAPSTGTEATKVTSASQDGAFAVMLRVTDTQVQKLHFVFTTAQKWHLELRPATESADSPENVESVYSVLREGVTPKQLGDAGIRELTPEEVGGN